MQSNDGDSTILYVPNAGFTGVDTLTFRANDGIAQSNTATVTIQVAGPQPTPPDQIHLAWVENPATTLTVVWRTLDVTTPSSIEYRPVGATTWQSALGALQSSGTSGTLRGGTLRALRRPPPTSTASSAGAGRGARSS